MDQGIEVEVLPAEDGWMIKEIIYGRLGLSRGLLRRMKQGGGVCLNGTPAYITERVKSGDMIQISFFDAATNLEPEDIALDVLYEDESLLVINKPAGMPVHPTRTYPSGTLANALAYQWQLKGYKRKVRLVHRIDRETSGVILIAKEPYSYQGLAHQLRTKQLRREYLAITEGNLKPEEGTIDAPIGRPEGTGHSLRRGVMCDGKEAVTHYRVVKHYPGLSLVRLKLETGRTHQIRVHLSHLGFPVFGDEIYGSTSPLLNRQALHAWSMFFTHPRTEKPITVRAKLPIDMIKLLQSCRDEEV